MRHPTVNEVPRHNRPRCRETSHLDWSYTVDRTVPWLAIRNIEDKRARERAKEAGTPKGQPRKAPPKLVEGSTIQGWTTVLNELSLRYPERFNPTI